MGTHRYNSYADYFRRTFGQRLQKLSVDAGFSCPNRSIGNRSVGGCTFCNNNAFNPSYCTPQKSISQQLDEGIEFHEHRYRKTEQYLAYFQAYSNTYAPIDVLKQRYEEALHHEKVAGLIIGTRPDCVDDEKLDYIASLSHNYYVAVEYGAESCYDTTLQKINRGHDFAATRQAIQKTADRGIPCGIHLILGLPGENRDMILHEADIVNSLPINTLKLHQLQILKGSQMEQQYAGTEPIATGHEIIHFQLNDYIGLVCDFLERLRPDIMMERFAGEVPPRFQAMPERSWRRPDGRLIRNEEIPLLVDAELTRRNSQQGARYQTIEKR